MNLFPEYSDIQSAVAIVAHPDDEIIWCGGLILRHPEWNWTILSLCRANDPDRRPKFERVCSHLCAQPIICDLDDSPTLQFIDPHRDIGRQIERHLGDVHWNLCLTHGSNGEYGHLRHKQVHREAVYCVTHGIFRCDALFAFAYDCDVASATCCASASATHSLPLTQEELAEKKRIIHEWYGFGWKAFEMNACICPESFQQIIGNA